MCPLGWTVSKAGLASVIALSSAPVNDVAEARARAKLSRLDTSSGDRDRAGEDRSTDTNQAGGRSIGTDRPVTTRGDIHPTPAGPAYPVRS